MIRLLWRFAILVINLSPTFCAPSMRLSLTPGFDENGDAQWIDVQSTFETLATSADRALFEQLVHSGHPNEDLFDTLEVFDSKGQLPIVREDEIAEHATLRKYHSGRRSHGSLSFQYRAWPRRGNLDCKGDNVFIAEGGGLSGSGLGFLILPTTSNDFEITISWNLTLAPSDTRYAMSLSERDLASPKNPRILHETYFLLGDIHSFDEEDFGMYWIDEPPFAPRDVGGKIASLYIQMAHFFQDPVRQYRVFVRHNENLCSSGTGFYRSFTFSWSDLSLKQRNDRETLEFLGHELVHNWIRLQRPDENYSNMWFTEGGAEYYSTILLRRFGLLSEKEFFEIMNRKLSDYYTSPSLNLTNEQIADIVWQDTHAHLMGYQRGFAYFVKLSAEITHQSSEHRSIDNLILDMAQRRLNGEDYDLIVLLGLMVNELGFSAIQDLDAMADGELIIPRHDSLGPRYRLRETRQEQFYLGFAEDSLAANNGKVRNLDPQSRAAEAGVLEGDVISSRRDSLWNSVQWGRNYTMIVLREGREIELSWSPRSFDKTISYQWTDVSGGSENEQQHQLLQVVD